MARDRPHDDEAQELEEWFQRVAGPHVAVVAGTPLLEASEELFLEEHALIARAVPTRRAEFSTGRVLARTALRRLGVAAVPILASHDRSPSWPSGFVGSISHTSGICVVAVAQTTHVAAIGLDVERPQRFSSSILDLVCTADEQRWIAAQPSQLRDSLPALVFSAKEAFYKLQYPLTKTFLEFLDVELRISEDRFSPRIRSSTVVLPPSITDVCGHCHVSDRFVASFAIWLRERYDACAHG